MRVTIEEPGVKTDEAHQFPDHLSLIGRRSGLLNDQRFTDDIKHRHPRIQGALRILEHHLDLAAKRHDLIIRNAQEVDFPAAIVECDGPGIG